jgi:hypothetical protein
MKRHYDAVGIQQGACNPHAIARSLVRALDECRVESVTPEQDAACQLICHQLAYILRGNDTDVAGDYLTMVQECEARSSETSTTVQS